MTTMTNTITNNSYRNNNLSDQSGNFEDICSSAFDYIFDQDFTLLRDEYEEMLLSSEIDSPVNSPSIESHVPNLVCGVCGAPAHGYNFDQITCESCKAFFRRNALRHTPHLRCRFSGSCTINIQTRRQCTYCRLKKCFDIKMRKDWIRTDEERELRQIQKTVKEQRKLHKSTDDEQPILNLPIVMRKKKRLMTTKPTISEFLIKPIFAQKLFGFNRNLSAQDQIIFNNITNAYQSEADRADGYRINKCAPSASLVNFINEETIMYETLILFYKCVPEFKQLDIRDQIQLIKPNLIKIVHLHCILVQKFQENPLMRPYMSKWIGEDFHDQMSRTRRYFDRFIEHPLILKLALIILVFTAHLSTPIGIDQTDEYSNTIHVYRIQEFYTTLLWRYLNHLFGEKDAIRSMEIIVTKVLNYQTLMNIMEDIIRQETDNNIINQLVLCLFQLT